MTARAALQWLGWSALLLVAATALVVGSQRGGPPPSLAARADAIALGVRCPVCGGQSVANSNTYAAQAIKTNITRRLRSGETPTQIRAYLVSRYGGRILESPPVGGIAGLVWWVPAVIVHAAAAGLLIALRRSRLRPTAVPSEADRALVAAVLRSEEHLADPVAASLSLTDPAEDTPADTSTTGPREAQTTPTRVTDGRAQAADAGRQVH